MEHEITDMIETYRQGFLQLDPGRIMSIWDHKHASSIYVAMEKQEPIYGWPAIEEYYAALPTHLDEMVAKEIDSIRIDLLGDTAIAFFKFHSTVRLKGREELFRPSGRVTMLFRHTQDGWRVIHYHESALAAQSADAIAARAKG